MLQYGNGYVYIDGQGYILEISDQKIDKPIIKGYSTPEGDLQLGNRLKEEDLQRLDTVIKIVEAAKSNEIENLITEIDISNKENYILILEQKGKTVYLGDASDINYRILKLKVILEKEEGNNGKVFLIDKNRMYFREDV